MSALSYSSGAPGARYRATILGCGSSGGVPRPGGADGQGDWGSCDPNESRNQRTRCSLLIERAHHDTGFDDRQAVTSILVDTSPDMRQQMIAARVARLDAALLTHHHADQTHGIDDLRAFAIAQKARVPVYLDRATAGDVVERFAYCFSQVPGSGYPPILEERVITIGDTPVSIDGPAGPVAVSAFLQNHGRVDSLGFRFGALAYSSDIHTLPEESFAQLAGVKIWIVDALQMKPHKTHAHLDKALAWIDRVRPDHAILTNLHNTMDYATLQAILPENVRPAFDGMTVDF